MEKKEPIKISLSTFFLILAIIAIVIMGLFMYQLNNEKVAETQKSKDLQNQVDSLNGTISDLQGKMNTISETASSNQSSVNTSSNNSSTTEKQSNSTSNESTLKNGTYETKSEIDPSDGEGIHKIKLESSRFTIDLFYGGSYKGSYTIKDNILICNANEEIITEGGDSKNTTNAIFEFKIINNSKLEFITNKNMPSQYTLNKGFIYNKK